MSEAPSLRLQVRLTPKAGQNKITGWSTGPDGGKILKISVTAVPEKGKANKALVNLLAKEWKLPKSAILLVKGETDRNKTLIINGISAPPL